MITCGRKPLGSVGETGILLLRIGDRNIVNEPMNQSKGGSRENNYCLLSLSFWNDCVLNGKSLLLKNWIRDPVLDYSFHPPTGVLKVISLTGIHSCRLLDSSSSSSTTTASASFERFSSYFPSALQATTARFLKGGNNLAVGMPDGDLYLTQDFSLPERETFHDLLSTGRRLNSSALRMPVKGIEALGDDLLLVAYQGGKG